MTVSRRWLQGPFVGRAAEIAEPFGADFASVFKAHFEYVWHSLRRLGVRERDLEDVVHDLFVTVHRRLDAYDPARPLRPWLFAFACRAASDYRKQARHRVVLIDDPEALADPASPVDEQAMAHEDLDRVARALDALEFDRRAIFVLHEIDGVSIPEVARALGLPTNTAYSRLRLARDDFQAAIRRMDLDRRRKRGPP
jgi:RNA polymerase sigma-70 factor (ECF subfamily)